MCQGEEKLYLVKMVFHKHDIDVFWLHLNEFTCLEEVYEGHELKMVHKRMLWKLQVHKC